MNIGSVIKECRKENQLTQQQLADMVPTTQMYLSRIENGQQTNISPDMIKRFAKVFGISEARLLVMAIEQDDIKKSEQDNPVVATMFQSTKDLLLQML